MTGRNWGRVIGHARNRENHRQQHGENLSAHVATIGALLTTKLKTNTSIKQEKIHKKHKKEPQHKPTLGNLKNTQNTLN